MRLTRQQSDEIAQASIDEHLSTDAQYLDVVGLHRGDPAAPDVGIDPDVAAEVTLEAVMAGWHEQR